MTSFMLGLTKAAVEGTLNRVLAAIEEETKLKERVQYDLVFITGEFQMMQSFLNVATKERARNEVVTTWLRQLRELAFDVEDCIELVVNLDKDKSTLWWRIFPSCCCVCIARPLDEVAAEIKLVKDRVEAVSQRNTRYNLILGTETFSRTTAVIPPATSDDTSSSDFQVVRQVWEDAEKIRNISIQELITCEEGSTDLQVISIWRNGDNNLEMPYIVNKAYHDVVVRRRFECRAWVEITRPFNQDEFINTLLTQLLCSTSSSHQATTKLDVTNVVEVIQQVLKEQRYLLVLEGVSNVIEWNIIRTCLPENNNGSRIIVTTPHMEIAIMCTGQPYLVSELKRFPALYAFFKRVPGRKCDMSELLWKIKCGGLITMKCIDEKEKAVLKRQYSRIKSGCEEFDGVTFKTCRWIPVVSPSFNPMVFWRRLLMDVHDEFKVSDLQELCMPDRIPHFPEEVQRVINMRDEDVIESCLKLLHEDGSYLLVIDGINTQNDWNSIEEILFSKPINGCVFAIANHRRVRLMRTKQDVQLNSIKGPIYRDAEARNWIMSFDPSIRKQEKISEYYPNGCVTSMWGIAGVGKSALARHRYYSSMVMTSSRLSKKTQYCWVDVPHPFCLTELSRRLLLDFHSDDLQAKEAVAIDIIEGKDPVQMCRVLMCSQTRCFLVLDGLNSTDDWDSLTAAFDLSNFCCKLIVVTNEQSVARHCVGNNDKNVINVTGLNEDDAFSLFIKKVGGPLTDVQLSKLIVAKCGGLPKVIAAIAGHLNKVWQPWRSEELKRINDHFIYTLENDVNTFQSLWGLFSWMQSYLDTCKDSLKPCMFYLPVFPVDHNIRRRRLLQRWIAEGYSRDTSSVTAEENGESLFSELVELSIIQQPSSKSQCRVNSFFYEYITSRPMEDNLVLALEGHCKLNLQLVGQHLSLRKSWDRDISVFESIDFSRLRSFTVFGNWSSFFISKAIPSA